MNHAQAYPSLRDLLQLTKARDVQTQKLALRFLLQLIQDPDPVVRWSTLEYLLRVPLDAWRSGLISGLIEELQEGDQPIGDSPALPDYIRSQIELLRNISIPQSPLSHLQILQYHSRLRRALFHIAGLHQSPRPDAATTR
jgi:hypothetical protein